MTAAPRHLSPAPAAQGHEKHLVFVWAYLPQGGRELLLQGLAQVDHHLASARTADGESFARFKQATIAFGNIPPAWLAATESLQWLQLESTGYEPYIGCATRSPRLQVTNLQGLFDRPVAETALAGLLGLHRGMADLLAANASGRWVELPVRGKVRLLHGSNVVVLGNGSIGRRVRLLLEAFECSVQSFARTDPLAELHEPGQLSAAFTRADVVVCCLPNSPATCGLVSRELLCKLPRHAVVVNVGRAPVLDEAALVELLRADRLGGAVLDVTEQEPLPPDAPLRSCPNTILTHHTGGGHPDEYLNKARFFLRNLGRFRQGEELAGRINLNAAN